MSKMKTMVAVAVSLVAVSSALYAAPWHHPEMRPEVQMQIDTDAVKANLADEYASLAQYINLGDKSKKAFDRYVDARVKADVEHAQWHNKNVPNADTRQAMLDWRSAHDDMRASLNDRVVKLRGELVKTMTPEQVAAFDRYEPAPMAGCGMRGRMGGWHGHMRGYHMNGDWQGHGYGYGHGDGHRRGPGCGW